MSDASKRSSVNRWPRKLGRNPSSPPKASAGQHRQAERRSRQRPACRETASRRPSAARSPGPAPQPPRPPPRAASHASAQPHVTIGHAQPIRHRRAGHEVRIGVRVIEKTEGVGEVVHEEELSAVSGTIPGGQTFPSARFRPARTPASGWHSFRSSPCAGRSRHRRVSTIAAPPSRARTILSHGAAGLPGSRMFFPTGQRNVLAFPQHDMTSLPSRSRSR